MTTSGANGPVGHQAVWELLPWYANGTLAAAEAEPVEAHIERCALCRRELELCRAMATAVDAAGGMPLARPGTGPPRGAADGGRESTAPSISAARSAAVGGRPRPAWWSETPRPARRALLAQAAALGLIVLGIAFFAGRSGWPGDPGPVGPAGPGTLVAPGAFQTLGDPGQGAPAADGATSVRLVLRDEATAADLRRLLAGIGGEIVAGPSRAGVLTVRLAAAGGDTPTAAAALERLRADPAVVFAEPAVVRPSGAGPAAGGAR